MICTEPTCAKEFTPKRPHQKFCSTPCRMANFAGKAGGLQGTVASLRKLQGGGVSIIVNFPASDADNALKLNVGDMVEVVT